MNIRIKLLLSYLTILIPVILIAYIGVSSTSAVSQSFDTYTQRNLPTDEALRTMQLAGETAIGSVNELAVLYTTGASQETQASEETELTKALQQLDDTFGNYKQQVNTYFAGEETKYSQDIELALQTCAKRSTATRMSFGIHRRPPIFNRQEIP